jgi:nucleotide sugar dehydrogenase
MKITVVGLGKIGLPLAAKYAEKGHPVIGADIIDRTVRLVNQGIEPFPGETDLSSLLASTVSSGALRATTLTSEAVKESEVVVVAVPLFVDANSRPDFEAIDSATRDIGRGLKVGTLVIYETTLPVGTTRDRFTPLLEQESGLRASKDFFVVFSPERVLTGRVFADLRKYPKLVGGIDPASEKKGVDFYEAVLDFDERSDLPRPNGVWPMGTAEAAELSKLAETTYRDVNIALANQFALHAEKIGVDVYKVIEACNSQNFSHIHQPGVAVGGHCIPVYPHLYLSGDPHATVVEASRVANKLMPAHVVERLEAELGSLKGERILVLGLSYRGGVKEHAFSGALDLVKTISDKGGLPFIHDPLYAIEELTQLGFEAQTLGDPCDAVIVHTDHDDYRLLKPSDIPGARFVVDGRNILSAEIKSSVKTYVLGIGIKQSSSAGDY